LRPRAVALLAAAAALGPLAGPAAAQPFPPTDTGVGRSGIGLETEPAPADGAGTPAPGVVIALAPQRLELGSGPGTLQLVLQGGPAPRAFAFTLRYESGVVAVTGVASGALFAPEVRRRADGEAHERLEVRVEVPAGAPMSSGGGPLALVTLSPLRAGAGTVEVVDAWVEDADGQRLEAADVAAEVSVLDLAPPVQTQTAQDQAAFAAQVPLTPEAVTEWTLAWLGLLAAAIAVVAVGWVLGRRSGAALRG